MPRVVILIKGRFAGHHIKLGEQSAKTWRAEVLGLQGVSLRVKNTDFVVVECKSQPRVYSLLPKHSTTKHASSKRATKRSTRSRQAYWRQRWADVPG